MSVEHNHHGPGGCHCRGGLIKGFIRPQLLLQLQKKPAYGYELLGILDEKDLETPDPSTLYRALNQFEEEGLVRSSWDTESSGPARRVYHLTDEGREHLQDWAISIRKTRKQLDEFLTAYRTYVEQDA